MERILIGTDEDGNPRYHYHAPGEHVLLTAREHYGDVTLPDGTTYNVTPEAVVVESQLHGLQVAAVLEGKDPAHVTEEFVAQVNDPDVESPVVADLPDLPATDQGSA
jgi:hypothetical protein